MKYNREISYNIYFISTFITRRETRSLELTIERHSWETVLSNMCNIQSDSIA